MNINEAEVVNYIQTHFHPYIDFTLNVQESNENESINWVISLDELNRQSGQQNQVYFEHNNSFEPYTDITANNVKRFVSKYPDTDILPDYQIKLIETIDGDTVKVRFQQKIKNTGDIDETQTILSQDSDIKKVRLVGINTPEAGKNGYQVSKDFLNMMCSFNPLYLAIDKEKPTDKYGRLLGVLIYNNKNINQMLLEERLAEIMFMPPSQFNPYEWSDKANVYQEKVNSDFSNINPFLNSELSNIVFTNQSDNISTIHRFEAYKGIIYVRLSPYNQNVRMHILPKSYDCSSNLLIFKDEDIIPGNEEVHRQFLTPAQIRNRKEQNSKLKKLEFNSECSNGTNGQIHPLLPISMTIKENPCIYQMLYDISENTQGFNTLQINSGYVYETDGTTDNNFRLLHSTGVLNESLLANPNEKEVLIDTNANNVFNASEKFVNHILKLGYENNDYVFPSIESLEDVSNISYETDDARLCNPSESGGRIVKTRETYETEVFIQDIVKYYNNDVFSYTHKTTDGLKKSESIKLDWEYQR